MYSLGLLFTVLQLLVFVVSALPIHEPVKRDNSGDVSGHSLLPLHRVIDGHSILTGNIL